MNFHSKSKSIYTIDAKKRNEEQNIYIGENYEQKNAKWVEKTANFINA